MNEATPPPPNPLPRRRYGLWLARGVALLGGGLLALNLVGCFLSLRSPQLASEKKTRFVDDLKLDYPEVQRQLARQPGESQLDFALRITNVIQAGLAHIDWDEPASAKYHLRIPPWENYLLYVMSYVRPADYRQYHFSSPELTMERGIGLCGDAACTLSELLEREGIETRILAFGGHVVTEAKFPETKSSTWLLDADFGVQIPLDAQTVINNPERVRRFYQAAGYKKAEIDLLVEMLGYGARTYDNTYEFSPKRTLFERASYVLIWVLPLMMLAAPWLVRGKQPKITPPSL